MHNKYSYSFTKTLGLEYILMPSSNPANNPSISRRFSVTLRVSELTGRRLRSASSAAWVLCMSSSCFTLSSSGNLELKKGIKLKKIADHCKGKLSETGNQADCQDLEQSPEYYLIWPGRQSGFEAESRILPDMTRRTVRIWSRVQNSLGLIPPLLLSLLQILWHCASFVFVALTACCRVCGVAAISWKEKAQV